MVSNYDVCRWKKYLANEQTKEKRKHLLSFVNVKYIGSIEFLCVLNSKNSNRLIESLESQETVNELFVFNGFSFTCCAHMKFCSLYGVMFVIWVIDVVVLSACVIIAHKHTHTLVHCLNFQIYKELGEVIA